MNIPRLIIAGTHSGVGKTTVAVGLMRAFSRRGLTVQPFKVGPDFIDPGHHTRATGRPSYNLDSWMLSRDVLSEIFGRATRQADIAIIEGVMGLYDGITGDSEAGSTAEAAKLLCCPVILVLDASAMARSVAALVQGYEAFDRDLNLAGVIANRVSGPGHFQYLKEAVESYTKVSLLGYLSPNEAFKIAERHLGLHTALEGAQDLYGRIADQIEATVDLNRVLDITRRAERLPHYRPVLFAQPACTVRDLVVAYAWDRAFCFYYRTNLDLLEYMGCQLLPFSPLSDRRLPQAADLIYFGGGYPELYAKELSENEQMLEDIRAFSSAGGSVCAECGGLMYLSEEITDSGGRGFPMAGLLPVKVDMTDHPVLRYIEVQFDRNCAIGISGMRIRGHEFHYSKMINSAPIETAFRIRDARGMEQSPDGFIKDQILASYTHLHFGSNSAALRHLVDHLRKRRRKKERGSAC